MSELGHAYKTKNNGSWDENGSPDGGSAAIRKAKRRRQQHQTTRIGEEVGDHLHVLGTELSRHNTSSDIVKKTLHHCSPIGEKLCALGSINSTLNGETICRKSVDSKGEVHGYLKAVGQAGQDSSMPTSISISTIRTCMEAMIRELREARAHMLQWMRQELHSMLYEGPATPCVHSRSTEHLRGHRNLEEHALQSCTTRNNLNVGMQLGGHSNGSSSNEFTAESDDGRGSKEGQESRDDNCAARGSSNGMEASGRIREHIICKREDMDKDICKHDSSSNQRIPVGIAGEESTDRDASFGACTPGFGHRRETGQMSVPSMKCRKNAFGQFATQSDVGRNAGDQSFNVQSDICGEMGFGIDSGTNVVGYGGCNNGCSLMYFEGLCSGKRNTAGLQNQHGMSSRVLNDEESPGFIALQSQAEAVDFESSTALNVMWNMMQQGERNSNQGISSSAVPNLYYDANAKLRSGEVVSRASIGNVASFDSPFGLISSASQRNAAPSLGRQVPAANHSLNSVDMPTLVTLQNQVAMQNPTTLQNFLGFNVGVGDLNRPMILSAGQKSLSSGKGAGVFIIPSVSLVHKKAAGF